MKKRKVFYKDLTYMERLIYKEMLKYAFPTYSVLFYDDKGEAISCCVGSNINIVNETIEATVKGSRKKTKASNIAISVEFKDMRFEQSLGDLTGSYINGSDVTIRFTPDHPTNKREENSYLEGKGILTNIVIESLLNDAIVGMIEMQTSRLTQRID